MADDAYIAFERDVPEQLREDAMTAMAEATSGWGSPANVMLLEHDRIDAVNARAEGIITIDGHEFLFQMEDGNRNGTVLLAWDSDKPFEYHVPAQWALQPKADLIHDAIDKGRGPFLVLKWDAIIKNRNLSDLPGKYAYDRRVQPGSKVEGYWKGEAGKHGFDIVLKEEADCTRDRLLAATQPYEGRPQ